MQKPQTRGVYHYDEERALKLQQNTVDEWCISFDCYRKRQRAVPELKVYYLQGFLELICKRDYLFWGAA